MTKRNVSTHDTLTGTYGDFTVDPNGDMSLAGQKLAWKDDLDELATKVDEISPDVGETFATETYVTNAIADAIADEMTEDQVKAIVNTAIQRAEDTGEIATETWVNEQLSNKQDKLTAGTNITIENNIISSTGGSGGSEVTYSNGVLTVDGVQVNTLNVTTLHSNDIYASELIESNYGILADGFLQDGAGQDYALQSYVDAVEEKGVQYFQNALYIGSDRHVDSLIDSLQISTLLVEDTLEVANGLTVDGYLKDINGNEYATEKYVDDKLVNIDTDYVKKTDIVVDSVPTQNSTNFVTSGGVFSTNLTQDQNFMTHRQTDSFRWSDVYQMEYDSLVRDANSQGLKLNGNGFTTFTDTYTVTYEYGGIAQFSLFTSDDTVIMTISINDIEAYSTEGLPAGPTIKKSFWVKSGDVITVTNPDSNTFTPFAPDIESPMFQLLNQVYGNTNSINILKGDVLDIQHSIQNQVLDPDPTHVVDIVNTSYTVTSPLGGRLQGIGYTLLGLLGVKVLSTGTIDITYTNGSTVREYDNTSLLGVGPANPFTLDVNDGDVIVSSGMDSLTFTPYIGA